MAVAVVGKKNCAPPEISVSVWVSARVWVSKGVGVFKRECNDEFQTNGEETECVNDVVSKCVRDNCDGEAETKGERLFYTYAGSDCSITGRRSSRGEH